MGAVSGQNCYSYDVMVIGNWCGQCQDRTGGVRVILWYLQVGHGGSVRTELLQLGCDGYR